MQSSPLAADATASRHWDQMPLHRGLELRLCRGLEIGEVAAGRRCQYSDCLRNKETEVAKAVERSCRKTALTSRARGKMWCRWVLLADESAAGPSGISCPLSRYFGFKDARRQKKALVLADLELYCSAWMVNLGPVVP